MKKLLTIGYEGVDFSDFLATLKVLNVTCLLDVRELPMSRRKGFSKTALREGLTSVGISYRHEPRLGSPKAIRHKLRADNDYKGFFKSFQKHLAKQGDLLDTLAGQLDGTVVLLCYERNHLECHRSQVAKALGERTGLAPKHCGVHGHAQRKAAENTRAHSGESFSPA